MSCKAGEALEPSFFDNSMRAARIATVGASKISLKEKSIPKRARRRESSCATVRESAPSAKTSSSTPTSLSSKRSAQILASRHSTSERGATDLSLRSTRDLGDIIESIVAIARKSVAEAELRGAIRDRRHNSDQAGNLEPR